jgi:hypothetical protein
MVDDLFQFDLATAQTREKRCAGESHRLRPRDFDVRSALTDLYAANPRALKFGTDLPSTYTPRPYQDDDYTLVLEMLGAKKAAHVFFKNAIEFCKPKKID